MLLIYDRQRGYLFAGMASSQREQRMPVPRAPQPFSIVLAPEQALNPPPKPRSKSATPGAVGMYPARDNH